MLFSIASIGLPIRCNPLSIILATGFGVFFARERAAETFPLKTLSLIIFMKLGSILLARRIAINLSKKKKIANTSKSPRGIINGPPFISISIIFIEGWLTEPILAAVLSESVACRVGLFTWRKNQFIRY